MTITEREAREFGVDVENLPKDVGVRVYPLASLGIDYQASGRLVAWWWDMRRDCWLVLVESGGPVTPWCVAHYRDGESERGSGRYYGSLSEAAAVWEMEQE